MSERMTWDHTDGESQPPYIPQPRPTPVSTENSAPGKYRLDEARIQEEFRQVQAERRVSIAEKKVKLAEECRDRWMREAQRLQRRVVQVEAHVRMLENAWRAKLEASNG